MAKYEVLLIAAEDVRPGDWIGEPTEQAQVCSVTPLPNLGQGADYGRDEWPGHQSAEGVKIFAISAQASRTHGLVVGRSLLALVGEPMRVTRPIDTAVHEASR